MSLWLDRKPSNEDLNKSVTDFLSLYHMNPIDLPDDVVIDQNNKLLKVYQSFLCRVPSGVLKIKFKNGNTIKELEVSNGEVEFQQQTDYGLNEINMEWDPTFFYRSNGNQSLLNSNYMQYYPKRKISTKNISSPDFFKNWGSYQYEYKQVPCYNINNIAISGVKSPLNQSSNYRFNKASTDTTSYNWELWNIPEGLFYSTPNDYHNISDGSDISEHYIATDDTYLYMIGPTYFNIYKKDKIKKICFIDNSLTLNPNNLNSINWNSFLINNNNRNQNELCLAIKWFLSGINSNLSAYDITLSDNMQFQNITHRQPSSWPLSSYIYKYTTSYDKYINDDCVSIEEKLWYENTNNDIWMDFSNQKFIIDSSIPYKISNYYFLYKGISLQYSINLFHNNLYYNNNIAKIILSNALPFDIHIDNSSEFPYFTSTIPPQDYENYNEYEERINNSLIAFTCDITDNFHPDWAIYGEPASLLKYFAAHIQIDTLWKEDIDIYSPDLFLGDDNKVYNSITTTQSGARTYGQENILFYFKTFQGGYGSLSDYMTRASNVSLFNSLSWKDRIDSVNKMNHLSSNISKALLSPMYNSYNSTWRADLKLYHWGEIYNVLHDGRNFGAFLYNYFPDTTPSGYPSADLVLLFSNGVQATSSDRPLSVYSLTAEIEPVEPQMLNVTLFDTTFIVEKPLEEDDKVVLTSQLRDKLYNQIEVEIIQDTSVFPTNKIKITNNSDFNLYNWHGSWHGAAQGTFDNITLAPLESYISDPIGPVTINEIHLQPSNNIIEFIYYPNN